MRITVDQLAAMINGTVEGDGSRFLDKFAPIEEAEEGALSFLSNMKYSHYLYTTKATAVLVDKDFVPEKEVKPTLIRVEHVYTTMSSLLDQFSARTNQKTGIEQPSYIAPTASIGRDVYIGAFAYIGEGAVVGDNAQIFPHTYLGDGATVGQDSVLYSGVKVYTGCEIGARCIIHSGTVIGSDGFGFAPQADGTYKKIPQTGKVIVKNDVEIGANTTIDRATIKATIIENGVKLDNLIQIAHNVEIGAHTVIASQTGISGSTKIGKHCAIGGQVGIVGHVTIADGSQIGAQSGISKSLATPNGKWFGSPAEDHKSAIKNQVYFRKLPEAFDRLQQLEKELQQLKAERNEE